MPNVNNGKANSNDWQNGREFAKCGWQSKLMESAQTE